MKNLRLLLAYFGCGLVVDCLITLFYRATAQGLVLVSSPLAFVIDVIHFVVFFLIIREWQWKYVIAYALGTSIGNIIGMQIL